MARTKRELGTVGLPIFSGFLSLDPNTRLRGRDAIVAYRSMAYDEPAAIALLGAQTTLLSTSLQVTPGGTTDNDKRAAEFVETCLADMRLSLPTYIRQMQGVFPYGYALMEVVYKRRSGGRGSRYDDGRVGWAHWGLRRQETVYRWQNEPDGTVTGFIQQAPPQYRLVPIPLNKCIHLVADDSEGSPEGRSLLRGMYRMWYIVKNLELLMGISLERFGTGLPVFEVDAGVRLTPEDQELLQNIAAGVRQNEEAYLILPDGVRFKFAASPGLGVGDYLNVIKYLRTVMLSTALADFISLGTDGGSYALGKDKTELFLLALNGYQDRIADAIQQQAVTRLFRFNDFGPLTDLPRVTFPAIKRYDLAKVGGFLKTIAALGAFHVTPADEALLRSISDMPAVDTATLEALHDADAMPPPEPTEAMADAEADEGDEAGEEDTDAVDGKEMDEEEEV